MGRDTHPIRNRLLAALPCDEYKRLQPHFELVQLLDPKKSFARPATLSDTSIFLTVAWDLCLPLLKAAALWKSRWWATKGC
jgi:hypothetical protein